MIRKETFQECIARHADSIHAQGRPARLSPLEWECVEHLIGHSDGAIVRDPNQSPDPACAVRWILDDLRVGGWNSTIRAAQRRALRKFERVASGKP